ncbi:hypothetical protein [Subtercola endophyticus]|nr:hypothetical protein [Subtercola endophyticus]UFS60203.1 hypothetical protein LQ955_05450 [Subtercola endophyticus]
MASKPFERPELTTPWRRFSGNLAVRISLVLVLLAATSVLAIVALSR